MLDSIRKTGEVIVIGVTKGRTYDDVLGLYDRGIRFFGENKVQEAIEKWGGKSHLTSIRKYLHAEAPNEARSESVELHMIGHLQTNKVKEAVGLFDMIQSVDSLRLFTKIKQEAEKAGKVMRVLIQVNVSKDPKKFGVLPEDVLEFFKQANPLLCSKWVKIEGLMAIVEHTQDVEARRPFFKEMKGIFDDLKTKNIEMKYLSMGMSEDFEIAIEEGANMIRVGRALFNL